MNTLSARSWSRMAGLPALVMGLLLSACDEFESNVDDRVDRQDVLATASVDESVQISEQETLYLQNVNGEIEIEALGPGSTIHVEAELIAGSDSRSDAEEWLDKLDVHIRKQSDRVVVETEFPNDARGRRLEVNYHVGVPAGIGLEVHNINGQITVSNVVGHVDVTHINGRIDVSDLQGTINAKLVNGTISCRMQLDPDGFAFLETVNGEIEFHIPNTTSARIHAETSNGNVRFENLTVHSGSGSDRERSGTMGDGGGQIELSAVNGTITVRGM